MPSGGGSGGGGSGPGGLSVARPTIRQSALPRPGFLYRPAFLRLLPPGGPPYRPLIQQRSSQTEQTWGNGCVWIPKGPPQAFVQKGHPPAGIFRPTTSPRRMTPGRLTAGRGLPQASTPPLRWKPTVGGQPRQRGRASVGLAVIKELLAPPPLRWVVTSGLTGRRNGRVWMPRPVGMTPVYPPPLRAIMAALRRPWRAGRALVAHYLPTAPSPVTPYTLHSGLLVCRQESSLRRSLGYLLRWSPAPVLGPVSSTGYHIYGNGGSGPIDYSSPIATTSNLTWTSGPLAFPDTWMFGVRAFNANGEELNLDAAVTIILDGSGNDITNRPKPPIALRAFPTVGGGIRAEWSYNTINPLPVPTGFHVYLGTPMISYGSPAATVSYQSSIAGTFVANISGLTGGDVYQLGVRAYNSTAEEPNTNIVTVTADSVGPGPVVSLTAVATA